MMLLQFLKLNTTSYPNSSNAFASLGDAYVAAHNKDLAIKSYQTAIELDKNNLESLNNLNNLKKLQ
jgi:Tfp pilus assembly protein PilF